MKRILSIVLSGIIAASLVTVAAAAELPFIKAPYVQNVTKTSAVVMWEAEKPTEFRLSWSTDEKPVGSRDGKTDRKIGEERIEGLSPDTSYSYTVEIDGQKLGGTFRTFPDKVIPFRFIAYTDTQDTYKSIPPLHRKFVQVFRKEKPRLIIHSGDLLDVARNYKSWYTAFFGPLEDLASDVPIFAALGNHEYAGGGDDRAAQLYFDFLSLPGNEQWYSFTFSNVHFISLNTEVYHRHALKHRAAEQLKWLKADLEAHKDVPWKVVFCHRSLYKSGGHGSSLGARREWAPLFETYGVNVSFNGHDHYYHQSIPIRNGRRDPKGVTYITTGVSSGRGGAPSFHLVYGSSQPSYATVDVDEDTMRILIRDENNVEIDRLVLTRSKRYLRAAEKSAESKNAEVRLRAVRELTALNDGTSGPALRRLAKDDDPRVREAALWGLLKRGHLSTDELTSNPFTGRKPHPRHIRRNELPLMRLYEKPPVEQMRAAEKFLANRHTWIRALGIRLLANVASEEALARLDKLSRDESPALRRAVAGAVGQIFDPYDDPMGGDSTLEMFLSPQFAEFPGRVASAEKVFSMLLRLLDEEDRGVAEEARRSLWRMARYHHLRYRSAAGCARRLIKLTGHPDQKVRTASIRCLPNLPPSKEIDALLVRFLDDEDKIVASRAVWGLFDLYTNKDRLVKEATPGLIRNVDRPGWFTRQATMTLLSKLTGKNFRRPEQWKKWDGN